MPWERRLWRGRPTAFLPHLHLRGERYVLTDLRLVRVRRRAIAELGIHDIGEVNRFESQFDRLVGTSTIKVEPRDPRRTTIVLRGIRRGGQLAALLELLSGDPRAAADAESLRATLQWEPHAPSSGTAEAVAALALVLIAIVAAAIGLHGRPVTIAYSADEAIYPRGQKRSRPEIVRLMEVEVMPWARATLGPLKGGAARITCETCHGRFPEQRDWMMPAVAALPQPDLKEQGWEIYGGTMDAQMRNAIYGYLAESDKQAKATYMREVVMPGMARILRRPAYDFTQPYEYNRSRHAFGCYHCHRVK